MFDGKTRVFRDRTGVSDNKTRVFQDRTSVSDDKIRVFQDRTSVSNDKTCVFCNKTIKNRTQTGVYFSKSTNFVIPNCPVSVWRNSYGLQLSSSKFHRFIPSHLIVLKNGVNRSSFQLLFLNQYLQSELE